MISEMHISRKAENVSVKDGKDGLHGLSEQEFAIICFHLSKTRIAENDFAEWCWPMGFDRRAGCSRGERRSSDLDRRCGFNVAAVVYAVAVRPRSMEAVVQTHRGCWHFLMNEIVEASIALAVQDNVH